MNTQLRILSLAFLVYVFTGVAESQVPALPDPKPVSLAGDSGDYRLGGGDLIEVSVYEVQSYRYTVRVAASGMIRLPLLGEILVEGKTASELEEHIEELLRGGIIRDPTVSVFTVEYKSRMVFVLGAVRQPGQFQIVKRLRVVDVLTMAGGLAQNAGDVLQIQRAASAATAAEGAVPEIMRINLDDLLTEGDLDLNVPLEDGDVITVPEKIVDYYYVVGEVNRAGAFELPEKVSILASQALARAGGSMKTAKTKNAVLVRYGPNQERKQIALNFTAIFKGKAPDVDLEPDDIIFVPGSQIKTLGYAMMNVIPTMVSRTAFIY